MKTNKIFEVNMHNLTQNIKEWDVVVFSSIAYVVLAREGRKIHFFACVISFFYVFIFLWVVFR